MFHELKNDFAKKDTSSRRYIPTARFLMQVKEENHKDKKKTAYLTFDDGPSEITPQVLDVLKDKKVRASFFLIGDEITKERKSLVKREVKEGHSVGVHTQCHKQNVIYASSDCFFQDFLKASELIEKTTGTVPKIHRFPWGSMNHNLKPIYQCVKAKLNIIGVRSFDWNCSGEDSIGTPSMDSIISNIKKDYAKVDYPIILLHDSSITEKTAKVLPSIIDMIRKDGYQFDTLQNYCGDYQFPEEWRK